MAKSIREHEKHWDWQVWRMQGVLMEAVDVLSTWMNRLPDGLVYTQDDLQCLVIETKMAIDPIDPALGEWARLAERGELER